MNVAHAVKLTTPRFSPLRGPEKARSLPPIRYAWKEAWSGAAAEHFEPD
jgi:hypothetical protein